MAKGTEEVVAVVLFISSEAEAAGVFLSPPSSFMPMGGGSSQEDPSQCLVGYPDTQNP